MSAGQKFPVAVAALILVLATYSTALGQTAGKPFDDSVRARMPALLAQHRVPGVAIALVRNGEVAWSAGFGVADTVTQAKVTGRTVFQVASISKSVSAWGFLRLVERGVAQLDVSVETYLKRWHLPAARLPYGTAVTGDVNAGVTLRRLLSHTAGLSLSGYPGFHPDSGVPTIEESLSGRTNGVGDVRVTLVPGTQWRYSGGGYTLAQLVAEELSRSPFADYMQRTILDPLKMERSAYEWTPALRSQTAKAYDGNGRRLPNYIWIEQAAAGLYTTADNLGRFVAAGMRGPRGEPPGRGVLRPETVELLYAPVEKAELPIARTAGSAAARYGFGHVIEVMPFGTRTVGHAGSNRGWKARWVAAPARGLGLVVLTNSDLGTPLNAQIVCMWFRLELRDAGAACRG